MIIGFSMESDPIDQGVSSYFIGLSGSIEYALRRAGLEGKCEKLNAELEGKIFDIIINQLKHNKEFRSIALHKGMDYIKNHPNRVAGRLSVVVAITVGFNRVGGAAGSAVATSMNILAINGNIRIAINHGLVDAESIAKAIAGGVVSKLEKKLGCGCK